MRKSPGLLAGLLLASAAFAKTAPMPEWVTNHRAIYPDTEFLAQRGSGKTAEAAELASYSM